jgi:hypothetical protein
MVTRRKALFALAFCAMLSSAALGSGTYYIPQAAAGVVGDLRFMTQISIGNRSASGADVFIGFLDNDGDLWTVNTGCTENAGLNGAHHQLSFPLPSNSKYAITVSLPGDVQVGWVAIISTKPLQVSATYGFYHRLPGTGETPSEPLWEAAVLPAPSAMEVSFPAHSRRGDMIFGVTANTGFAVANPNGVAVTVTARIRNEDGLLLATKQFILPREGHRAEFINELFTGADLSDVRAVVSFEATAPIALMAMREAKRLDKVVYSSLEVAPLSDQEITLDFDAEPNNDGAHAQIIQAPTQVYGTVCRDDNTADVYHDFYRVQLTAGQTIEILVLAGSLGSPLDPEIALYDEVGSWPPLAFSQPVFVFTGAGTGANDRRLSYEATVTGPVFISVGAGIVGAEPSPRAFYRMFVNVF